MEKKMETTIWGLGFRVITPKNGESTGKEHGTRMGNGIMEAIQRMEGHFTHHG